MGYTEDMEYIARMRKEIDSLQVPEEERRSLQEYADQISRNYETITQDGKAIKENFSKLCNAFWTIMRSLDKIESLTKKTIPELEKIVFNERVKRVIESIDRNNQNYN